MTLRTPYDGAPYYCVACGAGFYEFIHCERPDCDREDVSAAKRRQEKQRASLAVSAKSVSLSPAASDSDAGNPRSPSFPQAK